MFDKNNTRINPTPYLNKDFVNEPDYTGIITYQTYTNCWLAEVNKVDNTNEGYAGDKINFISGIRCKPQFGKLTIMVHTINGNWLDEISSDNYIKNDMQNAQSYAGMYGQPIDAVKIKTTRGFVDYRVAIKQDDKIVWLDWIRTYKEFTDDFAGIYGKSIYGIQMK